EREERQVTVTGDDMHNTVSKGTGVQLQRREQKETEKLLKKEEELRSRVIGQDEAVIAISKALRRSRADLKDPRRPIGSFIFLGPTGVGKTFLAQTLAEFMFGDRDALIQIDMSEYMEKFTASRLIGSPPGYVGYEEGGQLSEAVRRRPYSVVLFDEVEKAHPDVMHLLLQILEEGKITDSLGRKIDFRNTIIIMTSNVGAELLKKQTTLGFGAPREGHDYDSMREKILDETKRVFKPEFLNRLDEIIVFHSLEKSHLLRIVDLEVEKVKVRLKAKEVEIILDNLAHEFVIEKGYDPNYGARPMRRAVERFLEDPLAEEILRGNVKAGTKVQVSAQDGQLIFQSDAPQTTQQYHPLVGSVFWIENRLWDDSMLGHHLLNILLHAGSALLLFRILEQLAVPGAWLTAAVFALHPVQVESVAWLVELKNTLSGFLFFSALLLYLRFDRTRSKLLYVLVLFLFLLGLTAKTIAAVFP